MDRNVNARWTFRQDNAPVHTATVRKDWCLSNGVGVLDWPSYSSDLIPTENLWEILLMRLYKNRQQFKTLRNLKKELRREIAWILVSFISWSGLCPNLYD